MKNIIEVSNLNKKYKKSCNYALQNISFSMDSGEIIGLLGPNGAGKSTLIKSILGVIVPTNGTINIFGKSPLHLKKSDKAKIGVFLGGKSGLIYHLPLMDSLSLTKAIYKIPQRDFYENMEKYATILSCTDLLSQRVATLSLGQKLRAELLNILIFEPELLFLDEPTLGLDIEGKRQFRIILRKLVAENNIAVFLSTHDIGDVEKLCTRIIMLSSGKKVMDISNADFFEMQSRFEVLVTDCVFPDDLDGVKLIEQENGYMRYLVQTELVDKMSTFFDTKQCKLMKMESPRLEDILYEYYS